MLKDGKTYSEALAELLSIIKLEAKADLYTQSLEDGQDYQVVIASPETIKVYIRKGFVQKWYFRNDDGDLVEIPLKKGDQ